MVTEMIQACCWGWLGRTKLALGGMDGGPLGMAAVEKWYMVSLD